jgi:hypothetical protein
MIPLPILASHPLQLQALHFPHGCHRRILILGSKAACCLPHRPIHPLINRISYLVLQIKVLHGDQEEKHRRVDDFLDIYSAAMRTAVYNVFYLE